LIKLLVLDVDGTLTDGAITYLDDEKGTELKSFDVKDGMAVAAWNRLGLISAIITGRTSAIVEKRGRELGCKYILQGVWDKGEALREIINKEALSKDEVAVVGDDLNDIKMFKESGLNLAPSDCSHLLKKYLHKVLEHSGGKGAVREAIEYILDRNGLTESFIEIYTK